VRPFSNVDARDVGHASELATSARREQRRAVFASGGSDVLALVKDRIVAPDLLINLKTVKGMNRVESSRDGLEIGGLVTLADLARHAAVRRQYAVLAEAAESVATPQIRNVGTLAGNVCQRPWCWYFRNGFPCLKAGGTTCFSVAGENQFHAIFGGGPSYIVHPSDTAPALAALDARFRIAGSRGWRTVPAADFFVLPRVDALRENVLADDEVLEAVLLPVPDRTTRSAYNKVLDREAWTHAVVSVAVVLQMDGEVCSRAAIVLGGVAPVPWRVAEAERALEGQRVTPALAARVGEIAVAGARPLAQNAYKVPLTRTIVERTVLDLAGRTSAI
jgi:xanthine dehydrogenase YagS FAD-binding subunit